MPPGNKPFLEPTLTHSYVAIWHRRPQWVSGLLPVPFNAWPICNKSALVQLMEVENQNGNFLFEENVIENVICKILTILLRPPCFNPCAAETRIFQKWVNGMDVDALARCVTRARFLSLARSKLRLCSANHRPGYWSNLSWDWPSTAWAYSEQETENGPRTSAAMVLNMHDEHVLVIHVTGFQLPVPSQCWGVTVNPRYMTVTFIQRTLNIHRIAHL